MTGYTLTFDKTFDHLPNNSRTSICRSALLKSIEANEKLYKAYNFREKGFPDVIYQKPYKNMWNIFVKSQSNAALLMREFIKHLEKHPIIINNEIYTYKTKKEIHDIAIFPMKTDKTYRYKLITPLILFGKDHFPMFYAISEKYKDNPVAKEEELISAANRLIISNLKFQAQNLHKYKPYEEFDAIDIAWDSFDVRFIDYHTDERKTPAIFGSFRSTYNLPRFIGQKIGKGFGQINRFPTGGEF